MAALSSQLKKEANRYESEIENLETENLKDTIEGMKNGVITTPKSATSKRNRTPPTKSPAKNKAARRKILTPKPMPSPKKPKAKSRQSDTGGKNKKSSITPTKTTNAVKNRKDSRIKKPGAKKVTNKGRKKV